MKTFLKLLAGTFALIASSLAFAEGGVVSSLEGTATVQSGTGAPRPLRLGDAVVEGDTLVTGPSTTLIVRFDDDQVVALSSRSRLTVSTYKYNAPAKSGNILLSLVDGGMRALTGLIGKASPDAVTYKARTATIGIRGTDTIGEIDGNRFTFGVLDGAGEIRQGSQVVSLSRLFGVSFVFDNPIPPPILFSQLNFSASVISLSRLPLLQFQQQPRGPQPPADTSTTTTNTPNASGPTGAGGGGSASVR
ncbi:hypothetical protein DSM104443_02772 [Usitatibacter rugosus]|uniref:FecR protein domain-containing protein n=1 Tax=Usitatibacter rugosus TaxID=2732067 RepID=A0A6M4GWL9_9PROT|nr:FecR domain-containing protein [Usitatibacter rugosus]QJR11690.1 hypothetical protein DSM104443_02772 [Usitatibacter rugosus]